MAELYLKIGDQKQADATKFQDGDVMSAFHDLGISAMFAEQICHRNGLRESVWRVRTRQGNRSVITPVTIGLVWDDIESLLLDKSKDPLYLRTDYQATRPNKNMLKRLLIVKVTDFDEATRVDYESSDIDPTTREVLKKRKYNVDWKTDLSLTAQEISDAEDLDKEVDIRTKDTYDHTVVIDEKVAVARIS